MWGGIGGLVERGGEEVYVRVVGIVLYLGFLFDIGIFLWVRGLLNGGCGEDGLVVWVVIVVGRDVGEVVGLGDDYGGKVWKMS